MGGCGLEGREREAQKKVSLIVLLKYLERDEDRNVRGGQLVIFVGQTTIGPKQRIN